jgi:transaldolase
MALFEEIKKFVVEEIREDPSSLHKFEERADSVWQDIRKTGTRLWLDTGDIEAALRVWDPTFEALTTNNTLLNKEVQKGSHDVLIQQAFDLLRNQELEGSPVDMVLEINFILNARHALKMAKIFGGRVSVELHTDLANDVERSVEYGRRFYEICPEQFYIKVPFTPAGLIAARRLDQEHIPVNLTLGFSARQNFFAAQFAQPAFLNVFLGRLNSFVKASGTGSGEWVGEKTVRATQRMLRALRQSGRTESFLIAASMRNGKQVADLAGVDVMTLPVSAAQEYARMPEETPSDHTEQDLHIPIAPGFTTADFNGDTLWDVPEEFQNISKQLIANDPDQMTPESLMEFFAVNGFTDFLPAWTVDEIDTVMNDGKIPDFKTWGPRLKSRELGLDALMNISALTAFVVDQQALDERIRSFL